MLSAEMKGSESLGCVRVAKIRNIHNGKVGIGLGACILKGQNEKFGAAF